MYIMSQAMAMAVQSKDRRRPSESAKKIRYVAQEHILTTP
jgi:hypothetical protein